MSALTALKHVARFEYGDALAQEARTEGEVPVYGSNGITGAHDAANTLGPAIVVGRKGSFGKVTWTDVPSFCIDTAYFIDSRSTTANLRWLYWSLQTVGLDQHSEDTGVPGLSREKAYQAKLKLPPSVEQERIANFLDEKTARIDALIAEKERLQTALEEWREAELTRICFGGSDASEPTGSIWIQVLPKGWHLARLKHLVIGIEQGWSPECESRVAEAGEWGVLKAGASNGGTYRDTENKALPSELEPLPSLEVRMGDVLVSRASGSADLVGSFAYVYETRSRLMLSDKNFRLQFAENPPLSPKLLAWMCNTDALRQQVRQYVSGADGLAKNIGSGSLKELWLAVPPITMQPRLINELQRVKLRLDALEAHLTEHIDRLREYRSSLISAAVTGHLNIDDFQARQLEAA